jgi:hypothetical protein
MKKDAENNPIVTHLLSAVLITLWMMYKANTMIITVEMIDITAKMDANITITMITKDVDNIN